MGVFSQFPYTNFNELNLDAFFEAFAKLQQEWDNFGYSVTATAHAGPAPNVTVTGDLETGLNFDFTLVQGDKGDTGNTGAAGNGIASVTFNNYQLTFTFTDGTSYTTPSLRGATGAGLQILDEYATLADLQTAHPTGDDGDMYLVGTSPNFTLYIWSPSQNSWVDGGAITSPSPTITTPLMDGVADVGSEIAYARGDHIHPTDTSRSSQTDMITAQNDISDIKADIISLGNDLGDAQADITALNTGKQDALVSGTNIKTIENNALLGSGDIAVNDLLNSWAYGTDESITATTIQSKTYEVSGPGIVFIGTGITGDSSSGSGYALSKISWQAAGGMTPVLEMARQYARQETATTQILSAYATIFRKTYTAGEHFVIENRCTKTGDKEIHYNLLCFGCTLTEV